MPRKGIPWTPEADDALRGAVIAGTTLSALSKLLGRSESSIKSRAYILRVSLRPISPRERSQALPHATLAELGCNRPETDRRSESAKLEAEESGAAVGATNDDPVPAATAG